jgi:hypothetical protein
VVLLESAAAAAAAAAAAQRLYAATGRARKTATETHFFDAPTAALIFALLLTCMLAGESCKCNITASSVRTAIVEVGGFIGGSVLFVFFLRTTLCQNNAPQAKRGGGKTIYPTVTHSSHSHARTTPFCART